MFAAAWVVSILLLGACAPRVGVGVADDPAPAPESEAPEAPVDRNEEAQEPPADMSWTVVQAEGFAIAVPKGWRDRTMEDPSVRLVRMGDGIGLPEEDEHGEPLQGGIAVEVHPGPFEDAEGFADALLAELATEPGVQVLEGPRRARLELCDGSEAVQIAVSFTRPLEHRQSAFAQMVHVDDTGAGWLTSGYLVSGMGSRITELESVPYLWLAAHVATFCPSPQDFEDQKLRAFHEAVEDLKRGLVEED